MLLFQSLWNVILSRSEINERRGQISNSAPVKPISSKVFGLGQSWRKLLKARSQMTDNLRRNPFTLGTPKCTSTIFQLILVTS
jgi:hypothetical protein